MQGAILVTQYATAETKADVDGTSLFTSYYLALGAAGALLK